MLKLKKLIGTKGANALLTFASVAMLFLVTASASFGDPTPTSAPITVTIVPHAIYYVNKPVLLDYVMSNSSSSPIHISFLSTNVHHFIADKGSSGKYIDCDLPTYDHLTSFYTLDASEPVKPAGLNGTPGEANPNYAKYGAGNVNTLSLTVPAKGDVVIPDALDVSCDYALTGVGPFVFNAIVEVFYEPQTPSPIVIETNELSIVLQQAEGLPLK